MMAPQNPSNDGTRLRAGFSEKVAAHKENTFTIGAKYSTSLVPCTVPGGCTSLVQYHVQYQVGVPVLYHVQSWWVPVLYHVQSRWIPVLYHVGGCTVSSARNSTNHMQYTVPSFRYQVQYHSTRSQD